MQKSKTLKIDFKEKIRNVPNFPQKGIVFRDISPLLEDKIYFRKAIKSLVEMTKGMRIDKVVGVDARGFILAGVIAEKIEAGMVMVRKKGKLPFNTESIEYELEYGKSSLEIQNDSISKGEKVLLIDDVLATGGTMKAVASLVERMGGDIVGIMFLIVLDYLPGREILNGYKLFSLVNYEKGE